MHAATIDYGPYVGRLRAFGPPEVAGLPNFAGNASAVEEASGFWETVLAVAFTYTAAANVADRFPRICYFAGGAVPFATVIPAVARAATGATQYTFAVGVMPAGVASGPAILTPLPPLLILPGWTVAIDTLAGVAGDAVSNVRVTRQRFELIRDTPPDR